MKTAMNNVMLPTLFNVVNNIVQCCWALISLQSGVTMLNNIVDNIEQCGQQNIVHSCFHQARTGCSFFAVYLSDRKQFVNFKRHSSTTKVITDGVPQGSILGPLLFLIFINDLPLHMNIQVDLFAIDTTLLAATDYIDINELNEKLSLEVSNVQNWAITYKLPLNTTKTKTILISGKRLKAKLTPENQTLK